jgi:cytochrome c peroxidase
LDVPDPLLPYIGRLGAEVLGKALFWDMQVGSDNVQSCGTCHFHAGIDNRTRNQLNPGHLGGDFTLQVKGPNQAVVATDFPFHKGGQDDLVNDANDVMSSMGVRFRQFVDIPAPGPAAFGPAANGVAAVLPDIGAAGADPIPVFQDLRRVEPRNTPTMHSAAFNFDNFWDGRARFHFNGGSVFGPSDPQFHIFIDNGAGLEGTTNGHLRPDLLVEDPEMAEQPVRIKFSSLASQAQGPPLSDFEMSFAGRNWPKLGKKMLQDGVTPLANQLVAPDDSRLGPFSNQGGELCVALGRPTAAGKPGLCATYPELIRLTFSREYWNNIDSHLAGAPAPCSASAVNGAVTPAGCDPFDGYVLSVAAGSAPAADTNQFSQLEANFSLFFGLAVQMYEQLLIPDDTPFDQFMDANPKAANAVGQPGEQGVLFPTLVRGLVDTGACPTGTTRLGALCFPDLAKFGPDELFGFDIFGGANLTAALPPGPASAGRSGIQRNPVHTLADGSQIAVGSNPFNRSARCMLCHAGPEQTDHTINFAHGLLKGDAEVENPTPPSVPDPRIPSSFPNGLLPAPEATGPFKVVSGFVLADEVEEPAQDAVESEPRNMAVFDDPLTSWDDRIISQPSHFAFGDQGIYNIGVRPFTDDIGRGGNDPWGWPLSSSAMALKNIGGAAFEPCDLSTNVACEMTGFNPTLPGGGLFAPTGADQRVNPGLAMAPVTPRLPGYLAPWTNNLPAGELHPQIDELAFSPNTITPPNGGPAIEFGEVLFGADVHCGFYDPALYGVNGVPVAPNFGWGPNPVTFPGAGNVCPNSQSTVPNNIGMGTPNAYAPGSLVFPLHGTSPVPNRVVRMGAFKAPQLRNVELTGPYFHSGSVATLRQVVDFYMEGGEFPRTNAEHRDAHIINVEQQVFSFGRSTGADLLPFADALPDPGFQYDSMPDTDHPTTPEYATPEDAKVALVKFLMSLTDERVRFERAPFDRPELFVPVDGAAPDNTLGRVDLEVKSTGAAPLFRKVPVVGAGGHSTPLLAFLSAPGLTMNNVPSPIRGGVPLTISGTVEAGITPTVTMSTSAAIGAVSSAGADWSSELSGMPAGINTITVNAADLAGNPAASVTASTNVIFPDGSFSGTGAVSVLDALKALRIAAGLIPASAVTAEEKLHGDVAPLGAPDNVIDVNDALLILKKAVGLV